MSTDFQQPFQFSTCDQPISSAQNDIFHRTQFANFIAQGILNINDSIGTTIAIQGTWGTGKSSVINLIQENLSHNKRTPNELQVFNFKCWSYQGENALLQAFLSQLDVALGKVADPTIKQIFRSLTSSLLHVHSLLPTPVSLGLSIVNDFIAPKSPEETFNLLSEALRLQQKRLLIIIDDIDRLTPDEMMTMFRLIKTIGALPNVIYLLSFDRALAERTIQTFYPSEGPQFLDKIVQVYFDIPPMQFTDLKTYLQHSVKPILEDVSQQSYKSRSFDDVFNFVLSSYLTTPRHYSRYVNALRFNWPAMKQSVNKLDFLAMEAIRLFDPTLYQHIYTQSNELLNYTAYHSTQEPNGTFFSSFKSSLPNTPIDSILSFLFPKLQGSEDNIVEKRICETDSFEHYFCLSSPSIDSKQQQEHKLVVNTIQRKF